MSTVLHTILPVAILIAFGFGLGQLKVLDAAATAVLVRFSVTILVPVALFLEVLHTSRQQLSNFSFVATMAITFLGMYAIGFAIGRFVLRNASSDSSVEAAAVSFPNLALVGLPVYQAYVGQSLAAVTVATGNIITSLTIVPFTMAILAGSNRKPKEQESIRSVLWAAIKPPLVWLPILGVILTLLGINHLPAVLENALSPLGHANAGVGLVALGLLLTRQHFQFDAIVAVDVLVRMIVPPLLVLGLVSLFGIEGPTRLALLLVAVTPTAGSVAMIAANYRTNASNAAATVLLTTLLSLIAFPLVARL